MALVLKDRVKETTLTTGTGSFALAGAVTGYDSFGQIGNGNTTYYAIYLDGGSEWEVGIGTYTSPSTLSRDTILASSNAGSVVTFSAGQKTIWCDYPAEKAVYTDASGSISEPIVNISGITGHINTVDYVGFDTTYATTLTAGQLGWDGNNTLAVGMAGGNVVQHIGEDSYFYIKASSAITKGQLIMFTGALGASGVLTGAPSTGVTNPNYIMGIAAEDIANNGFGLVQWFGQITNVNTNSFNEGDVLYYDSAVTGGLTNVYPTSGIIVTVAAVAKKSAGGGVLYVRVGVTQRITASTGISVSQTNAGATITNTAPDQTVSLSAGTGISTSGTYPNFTITNTAPDQIVALTGAGTTTISGTYPNFTITSNDQYTGTVTAVTGTSPIVSSGGNTPAISIPAANGSTNGYLTSTDWTTFNNKGSGTVTSVAALTLGTTGTDLSSTVANSTTTPVITLNVPTASATNRGALSSTDWTTFNNKAPAVTYTTNYVPYGQGTTTPNQSANFTYNGTVLTAQVMRASNGIVVNNKTVSASYTIASGDSAMSAGPITVNSGVSVTVSSGSRWVVL